MGFVLKLVLFSIATSGWMQAHADIKIAMVLPLSGPLAATGNDIAVGAKAYIDSLNAAGGIATGSLKNQRIELLIEDDRFDAKVSEEIARKLVRERGAVALLSCFGTVSCLAVAKVAQETGAPLIGPIAGAEALRKAENNRVFALRAHATDEISALIQYLQGIQQNSAAVIVQKDGFGDAYAASFKTASDAKGFSASTMYPLDPKAPDYQKLANQILQTQPSSLILIANTVHSVGMIKALNQANYFGQILNLAGQANGTFVQGLANGKQIAIFATLTPSPTSSGSLEAKDFRASLAKQGNFNPSYINFESYLNTKLAVEALRRASASTPAALLNALQAINGLDLAGIKINFSGNRRQGASYTDVAVLKTDGKFRQ